METLAVGHELGPDEKEGGKANAWTGWRRATMLDRSVVMPCHLRFLHSHQISGVGVKVRGLKGRSAAGSNVYGVVMP